LLFGGSGSTLAAALFKEYRTSHVSPSDLVMRLITQHKRRTVASFAWQPVPSSTWASSLCQWRQGRWPERIPSPYMPMAAPL
jgi:hypothetical protein